MQRLGAGPFLATREGKLFIFAPTAELRKDPPLAGPFETRFAAGWWLVEQAEQKIKTPAQLALWGNVLQKMGGTKADPFHALFVLVAIAKNAPRKTIWRYAMGYQPVEDFKERAAGSQEVA